MRIYGLTGGTGSGKSTAARRFEARGIPVIDADRVGHEVIAPGGPAERGVLEVFGECRAADGSIDREKLGRRVFGDAEALRRLNALVHPAIFVAIGGRCAELAEAGHKACIIDAALLAEGGTLEPWLEGLILVLAPASLRLERLAAGRGIAPEEAARRMAVQLPPEDKKPLARWVIMNDGSLEHLYAQVDAITREILDAA